MTKIENYKYSIAEAFRDCFYVIPDYQRECVWTEKEAEQLLEDLNEQIDSGKARQYFVGTVLVSSADPEPKTRFEVIDGQQRLTTRNGSRSSSQSSRTGTNCGKHILGKLVEVSWKRHKLYNMPNPGLERMAADAGVSMEKFEEAMSGKKPSPPGVATGARSHEDQPGTCR